MSAIGHKHEPAFKTRMALAALRRDATVLELTLRFGADPIQIYAWKLALVDPAPKVLSGVAPCVGRVSEIVRRS